MGDAVSHLAAGDCGVRWTAPAGTIVQHSEHEVIVRDERKLIWHASISPRPFAAAPGEEAALAEDMEASARAAYDAHWYAQDGRAPGERPRTAEPGWSPIIEVAIVELGGGRAARVIRHLTHEPNDEMVAGHYIVPVAMGAVEVRVVAKLDPNAADPPLVRARAALDVVREQIAVTRPASRQRYVALPDAGCAFVPPPRFLPVPVKAAPGHNLLWRGGLDGWRRLLDVWRIGKMQLGDKRAGLIEHADRVVRDWQRDGATDIQLDTRTIADHGGMPQIEQYVTFRGGDTVTHTLHRWWIDGSDVVHRIGSNGPPAIPRAALAADLDDVQRTWRAI